jgi:hypothetical protein
VKSDHFVSGNKKAVSTLAVEAARRRRTRQKNLGQKDRKHFRRPSIFLPQIFLPSTGCCRKQNRIFHDKSPTTTSRQKNLRQKDKDVKISSVDFFAPDLFAIIRLFIPNAYFRRSQERHADLTSLPDQPYFAAGIRRDLV